MVSLKTIQSQVSVVIVETHNMLVQAFIGFEVFSIPSTKRAFDPHVSEVVIDDVH